MKKIYYTLLLSAALFAVGCTEDSTSDLLNSPASGSNGSEIEGETIRFTLDTEDTRTELSGMAISWNEGDCINVNKTNYNVKMVDGQPVIDVAVASDGVYEAVYPGNNYSSGLIKFFRQNPMQFYSEGSFGPDANPLYANVTLTDTSKEPKLSFSSLCGVLMLTIKGTAEVESIYVEDRAGENVSGDFQIDKTNKIFKLYNSRVCRKGVVLNCLDASGKGLQLSESGTVFYIVMPAREYASGLNIRISDTKHRSMTLESQTPRNIERNAILVTPAITYNPTTIYEEHFDLMVWGGDIMGGNNNNKRGYTPTAANTAAPTSVTGFERTLYDATYDIAGSNFMSTNYSDMTSVSHNMSESYLRSRGVFTAPWLFRVEERPGYIGVGAKASGGRGRYRTAPFTNLSKPAQVAVEFKFAAMAGLLCDVNVWFRNSGFITEAYLDGTKIELTQANHGYTRNGKAEVEVKGLNEYAEFIVDRTKLTIPAAISDVKTWHTLKFVINDARDDTAMDIYATSSSGSALGYYVDDIVVTKVKDMPTNTLKVLYWNIQQGMWADQHNGYKNFTAWVKKQAPDICVWCEAKTNWQDKNEESITKAQRQTGKYLVDGNNDLTWSTVAKAYGHSYWTFGAYQDNFPVVITSSSSLSLKQKLGNRTKGTKETTSSANSNVSHGGFHVQQNGINFVGLHLWPQAYKPNASNQTTSANNNEGDTYRLSEMKWIIGQTKNSSTYKSQKNWIMCGDFNSKSRQDEQWYNYGSTTDTRYKVHNYILDNTDYKDIIRIIYGNKQAPSRIDFMYASPDMMKRVVRAYMPNNEDDMTTKVKVDGTEHGYKYSDHNCIIVEFEM